MSVDYVLKAFSIYKRVERSVAGSLLLSLPEVAEFVVSLRKLWARKRCL